MKLNGKPNISKHNINGGSRLENVNHSRICVAKETFAVSGGDFLVQLGLSIQSEKPLHTAMTHFLRDIEQITGGRAQVIHSADQVTQSVVWAGVIGCCPVLDDLISRKKVDVTGLAGQWESFVIQKIENPWEQIDSALLIIGSDVRGAVYGLFELSEKMGVSPWYFWADVPPVRRKKITISDCNMRQGPPSVKYRGIFINDESWGLTPWASYTFAPEDSRQGSGLGPKTYARIYELMLRLKGNFVCPGMHVATRPFNFYEENKQVASDYGIIIGTSHCEPMLRNNEGEWRKQNKGPWQYHVNRDEIYDYWEERIKTNHAFENIYTMGMRGVHDSPMEAYDDPAENRALLEKVMGDQQEILRHQVNSDLDKVPQALYLYKEMLNVYQDGLKVPDDVMLVWPDDNYGYIRELPGPTEQKRRAGNGVYYHISYYGLPQGYLWLCSTPLSLIAAEMTKALKCQADKLWVVNVGNFKNHELALEFFIKLGWDAEKWNTETVADFYEYWARRDFGDKFAAQIAKIKKEYFRLNFICKPEHMEVGVFSNIDDEVDRRMEVYADLVREAESVYEDMSESCQAAFYQLVLYPLRCSLYMNEKFLYAQKNHLYAHQKRQNTEFYAQKAIESWNKIKAETEYYNNQLSGGKWHRIVTHTPHGTTDWTRSYDLPTLKTCPPPESSAAGIVINNVMVSEDEENRHLVLDFSKFTQRSHAIEIFNRSNEPIDYELTIADNWIKADKTQGRVICQNRISLEIDWPNAPQGNAVISSVKINAADIDAEVRIQVLNPANPTLNEVAGCFMEDNGYVSINAASFEQSEYPVANLKVVEGLGRTGRAVWYVPQEIPPEQNNTAAPVLNYDIFVFHTGPVRILVDALPTHRLAKGRQMRYSVSLDGQKPAVVNIDTEEYSEQWSQDVLRGVSRRETEHFISNPGRHKLSVRFLDAGLAIDKIMIDMGGLKESYLGPDETRVKL